ncbi:hypothetical protein PP175_26015 (plasmid) [Aneurinibacillus sp. Ricciae_BoGa-3]|uniref:hypothetical protein n=1 Tax=Aneurinibacillus sp. Ricciae_BoGa-3 TaxID=3022697 RepID=UPI002341DE84|nr:hypothetical protein [Aneurinibacillus sp. Ricciae_BoGa-3]WCK57523.1 hypothetical protein PP175_26015 [Aneurinibacillus sp. Ricciae_BoGa-3]
MKLIECLNQFPDDSRFKDLLELNRGKRIKSIGQIKQELQDYHANESGYEIREQRSNYGKTIKKELDKLIHRSFISKNNKRERYTCKQWLKWIGFYIRLQREDMKISFYWLKKKKRTTPLVGKR